MNLFDTVMDVCHRNELFVAPVILVEWHEFDESNVERTGLRQVCEIHKLIAVEVFHCDDVQLDALNADIKCCIDRFHNLL